MAKRKNDISDTSKGSAHNPLVLVPRNDQFRENYDKIMWSVGDKPYSGYENGEDDRTVH